MSDNDLKIANLLSIFEDINQSFIEQLIIDNPNDSLSQLIDKCLQHKQQHSSQTNNNENDINSMISEIPSSLNACYFDDDIILEDIESKFHILFKPYSFTPQIPKLIEIFHHLTAMKESSDIQSFIKAVETQHKLLSNIYQSPNNEKYRRIRESNKLFQKRFSFIEGSKLFFQLCGWQFIIMEDSNNSSFYSSIFIYNSSTTENKQEMDILLTIKDFLFSYLKIIKHQLFNEQKNRKQINQFKKSNSHKNVNIRKNKFEKRSQSEHFLRNVRNSHKLSLSEIRQKRIQNLGDMKNGMKVGRNYHGIGPRLDISGKPFNIRGDDEYKESVNGKKRNKRHFNLDDIEQLRREDFDVEARGPAVTSMMDAVGKEALRLTNEFRGTYGLPALKWHQSLCNIGKKHSEDMSKKKVKFGHDGFSERAKAFPFTYKRAAENVAMNNNAHNVAKVAVDGWISSPGHKKNLLALHTHCGIGVYQSFDGPYYLTQLFAFTHMYVNGSERRK